MSALGFFFSLLSGRISASVPPVPGSHLLLVEGGDALLLTEGGDAVLLTEAA